MVTVFYREFILPYSGKKKFPLLKVYRNITIINKPNDANDNKKPKPVFFLGKAKKNHRSYYASVKIKLYYFFEKALKIPLR